MQQPTSIITIPQSSAQNAEPNSTPNEPTEGPRPAAISTSNQVHIDNTLSLINVQNTAEKASTDTTSADRLKALLTMFSCSNRELKETSFNQRLQKLNDSKHVKGFSVLKTRPSRDGLANEVLRRFKFLCLKELHKQKQPRQKHWEIKRSKEQLILPMYQLPEEDKNWLEKEIELILSHHEYILSQKEEDEDSLSLLPKTSREK